LQRIAKLEQDIANGNATISELQGVVSALEDEVARLEQENADLREDLANSGHVDEKPSGGNTTENNNQQVGDGDENTQIEDDKADEDENQSSNPR